MIYIHPTVSNSKSFVTCSHRSPVGPSFLRHLFSHLLQLHQPCRGKTWKQKSLLQSARVKRFGSIARTGLGTFALRFSSLSFCLSSLDLSRVFSPSSPISTSCRCSIDHQARMPPITGKQKGLQNNVHLLPHDVTHGQLESGKRPHQSQSVIPSTLTGQALGLQA